MRRNMPGRRDLFRTDPLQGIEQCNLLNAHGPDTIQHDVLCFSDTYSLFHSDLFCDTKRAGNLL